MASNNIPPIKIANKGGSFSIRSNLNTKTSEPTTEQHQYSDIEFRQKRIAKLARNPTIENEMETDSEFSQNWKPVKTSSKKRKVMYQKKYTAWIMIWSHKINSSWIKYHLQIHSIYYLKKMMDYWNQLSKKNTSQPKPPPIQIEAQVIEPIFEFLIKGLKQSSLKIKSSVDLSSDHTPIIIKFTGKPINLTNTLTLCNNTTDWNLFKRYINENLSCDVRLKNPLEMETAVDNFTTLI